MTSNQETGGLRGDEPARNLVGHGSPPVYPPYYSEDDRISLLQMVNAVLRHWRLLVTVPCIVVVAAIAIAAVSKTTYTAESAFSPQVPDGSASRLAGFAAQLGISVGAGSGGRSIDFYAHLLTSNGVLRDAVLTHYRDDTATRVAETELTLVDLYEIPDGPEEQRVRAAVSELRANVATSIDARTGLVELRTTAASPEVALQINRRLLSLLNEFNLNTRQSQTRLEREFVEARLRDAESNLRAAESDLQRFLQQNRRFQDSPELIFENARLERRVELRQQVHNGLAQALEQARIEEVRNTPVITVIEDAEGFVARNRPSFARTLVVGILVGILIALALIFALNHFEKERQDNPSEYARLQAYRLKLSNMMQPLRGRKVAVRRSNQR